MNKNAVVHGFAHNRKGSLQLALLTAAAVLLGCLGSSAAYAAQIGKDGQIHACYRVKGKPKGALRVVANARAHCRRGERKVTWSIAPSGSAGGQTGAMGQTGQGGAGGASGTTSREESLQAQIAGLTLKVENLEGLLAGVKGGDLNGLLGRMSGVEGVLGGVSHEGLTHAVDTVKEVTGSKLQEAVEATPLLETVCDQVESLTGRSNALLSFLDTLDTLNLLSLPSALPSFEACS